VVSSWQRYFFGVFVSAIDPLEQWKQVGKVLRISYLETENEESCS